MVRSFNSNISTNDQLTKADEVWQLYKTYHSGKIAVGLENEIKTFMKEQSEFSKLRNKDEQTTDDQHKMVRKLPQVTRKQAIYGTHRKFIEMISAQMKQA